MSTHENCSTECIEKLFSTLSRTIKIRDIYTVAHQKRVSQLAVALGDASGLDTNRLIGLRLAGDVHDIGKMGTPAEILSKPGPLDDDEYALIKRHAQVGSELLKDHDFPWPITEAIHQHHERMDGSGYPRGLKGEAICLEARIIAVADVVETMASHRPYRPALGILAALKEIKSGAGIHFDPDVVGRCLKLFSSQAFSFPHPAEERVHAESWAN